MIKLNFTYGIVTPESAEQGDYAESGFCNSNGDFRGGRCKADRYKDVEAEDAARAAVSLVGFFELSDHGGLSVSLYASDGVTDYSDASETTFAAHATFPNERVKAAFIAALTAMPEGRSLKARVA